MKNWLKLCIISMISFVCLLSNVNAESMVDITYVGSNSITVNEEVTLYLQVQNIEDYENGVVALGGYIIFDEDYLELISITPTDDPYQFLVNPSNNYKIAGLSFTMNGIKEDTTIITLVFKAKKTGSTEITFEDPEVCDSLFQYDANIIPKTLTINDEVKEEVTTKTTTSKATTTTKTTTKVANEEETTNTNNVVEDNIINIDTITNETNNISKKHSIFNTIKTNIINFTNKLFNLFR